ncbi:ABC transporter [Rhodococcus rhodochrous]|nr:ABC transporter [Rhodococcus rhodochrous]
MTLALATTLRAPLGDAVERTRAALKEQGFGVLTEIDMQATLKTKIDVDMEPYVILGACNPPLAHQAVSVNRQIGLLLPCNVVVRRDPEDAGLVHVEAMNPQLMVQVAEDPGLQPVADEAARRLQAAIDALGN